MKVFPIHSTFMTTILFAGFQLDVIELKKEGLTKVMKSITIILQRP